MDADPESCVAVTGSSPVFAGEHELTCFASLEKVLAVTAEGVA